MTAEVSNLYTQYLGRPGEPEGLSYWHDQFGDTVDQTELGTFLTAAHPELLQRTPEQLKQSGLITPGSSVKTVWDLYGKYAGRTPDANGYSYWSDQLKDGVSPGLINRFASALQPERGLSDAEASAASDSNVRAAVVQNIQNPLALAQWAFSNHVPLDRIASLTDDPTTTRQRLETLFDSQGIDFNTGTLRDSMLIGYDLGTSYNTGLPVGYSKSPIDFMKYGVVDPQGNTVGEGYYSQEEVLANYRHKTLWDGLKEGEAPSWLGNGQRSWYHPSLVGPPIYDREHPEGRFDENGQPIPQPLQFTSREEAEKALREYEAALPTIAQQYGATGSMNPGLAYNEAIGNIIADLQSKGHSDPPPPSYARRSDQHHQGVSATPRTEEIRGEASLIGSKPVFIGGKFAGYEQDFTYLDPEEVARKSAVDSGRFFYQAVSPNSQANITKRSSSAGVNFMGRQFQPGWENYAQPVGNGNVFINTKQDLTNLPGWNNYGASSYDSWAGGGFLAKIIEPVIGAALAFIPGVGPALSAGFAAVTTHMNGGDFGDMLKSAALSYAGGKLGTHVGEYAGNALMNSTISSTMGPGMVNAIQAGVSGASSNFTSSLIKGGDFGDALKSGLLGGLTSMSLSGIDGQRGALQEELGLSAAQAKAATEAVKRMVATKLSGGDLEQIAFNAALGGGLSLLEDPVRDTIKSTGLVDNPKELESMTRFMTGALGQMAQVAVAKR
jgi:hypothetical protein